MADKLTAAPRNRLARHIGHLGDGSVIRLDRAMLVFRGLAGTPLDGN